MGINKLVSVLYRDTDDAINCQDSLLDEVKEWGYDIRRTIAFNFDLLEGWLRFRFPDAFEAFDLMWVHDESNMIMLESDRFSDHPAITTLDMLDLWVKSIRTTIVRNRRGIVSEIIDNKWKECISGNFGDLLNTN